MGLLLPSGAYHGPSGRSHDSLTINAFMSGNKFPINRYARSIPEIDRWHIEETELLKNPEYFRDLSQVRFGGGGGGVGHGGATSTSSWTKGPYDRILARVAHKIDQVVKQREAHGNHERAVQGHHCSACHRPCPPPFIHPRPLGAYAHPAAPPFVDICHLPRARVLARARRPTPAAVLLAGCN